MHVTIALDSNLIKFNFHYTRFNIKIRIKFIRCFPSKSIHFRDNVHCRSLKRSIIEQATQREQFYA